jgi:hypothetical protein
MAADRVIANLWAWYLLVGRRFLQFGTAPMTITAVAHGPFGRSAAGPTPRVGASSST